MGGGGGGPPFRGGGSHITTRGAVGLVKLAGEAGADAVSVLTPMFISQTQNELYRFYEEVAASTSLPIILYNNRPKTNVHIEPATVARLAQIENIVGVKDSTGDMTNTADYIIQTRHIENFHVLMGRDTLIYAALCYGASGAIASCANVAPALTVEIYERFMAGDHKGALEAQFRLTPLRNATNMGTFPQVIKESLEILGISVGKCLDPIDVLAPEQHERLVQVLKAMELM
ncbi:MAG: dihydrodipicolinate synthase family protein [Oscillospiraceae bacterium]|nr:dihydrodipicolinate synthase family protein [Oscillospiraceae bacterium]